MATRDEKLVGMTTFREKDPALGKGNRHRQLLRLTLTKKKVLLSVWWDYKGIDFFELNQTINSEVYIRQPTNLNNAI